MRECKSASRKPIEVRRREPLGAEHPDVTVSLVVGEDDDDVGETPVDDDGCIAR